MKPIKAWMVVDEISGEPSVVIPPDDEIFVGRTRKIAERRKIRYIERVIPVEIRELPAKKGKR